MGNGASELDASSPLGKVSERLQSGDATLTKVDFTGYGIGDAGVERLAPLLFSASVKAVLLQSNNVGSAGADALARARAGSPTMDATGMDVDAPYAAAEPSDATTQDGAPIAGQIKELQNSIAHLLRSNKEMEEIIAESGPDKELRDAIGENIVVIARRKAILADLLKLLAETDPSQPAAAAATAAPPLTADGSTADAGVYL